MLFVVVVGMTAAGCVQTKPFLGTGKLPVASDNSTVLLMPPDVELSLLTAGGLLEPNAAWTATGRANVDQAIEEVLAKGNDKLVRYQASDTETTYDPAHTQLVKLHEAVGSAILVHKYNAAFVLPTKKDTFDYKLGSNVALLREAYDADYALFPFFRDSFTSGGRAALILIGAAFGVGITGGTQVGFASLVDLRSGEVVWFNTAVSGTGDLRKPDSAKLATEGLLSDLPL